MMAEEIAQRVVDGYWHYSRDDLGVHRDGGDCVYSDKIILWGRGLCRYCGRLWQMRSWQMGFQRLWLRRLKIVWLVRWLG